jgi:quinol monooxygenase YgiN
MRPKIRNFAQERLSKIQTKERMTTNVLVTVTYKINKSKADEYILLAHQFLGIVNNSETNIKGYLYVDNDEPGNVVEVYECPTPESYDQLEDSFNDATHELMSRMAGYVLDRQSVRTLIQKG